MTERANLLILEALRKLLRLIRMTQKASVEPHIGWHQKWLNRVAIIGLLIFGV